MEIAEEISIRSKVAKKMLKSQNIVLFLHVCQSLGTISFLLLSLLLSEQMKHAVFGSFCMSLSPLGPEAPQRLGVDLIHSRSQPWTQARHRMRPRYVLNE